MTRISFKYALAVSLVFAGLLPTNAQVVINEIFYHAPNNFSELEWVELHNTSDQVVDLSNWKLKNGVQFTFPSPSQIDANGYLVLSGNADLFHQFYSTPLSGEFGGKLNNGGETIELSNAQGTIVDSVTYDDKAPWTSAPDGRSPSLERIVPTHDGNDPYNWAPSALPADTERPTGTPGAQNDSQATQTRIPLTLQVTSPQVGQAIQVTVKLPESAKKVRSFELGFQIVRPGQVGEEVWVSMNQAGDELEASIPAQPGGTFIRYRVALNLNDGNRIYSPHPNEIRPAHSLLVPPADSDSQLPGTWIINTDPTQQATIDSQLKSIMKPSGEAHNFSGDLMMARYGVRNQLSSLAHGWFSLAMDEQNDFSPTTLKTIQTALLEADEAQRKLLRDLAKDTMVAEQGVTEIRKQLRARLGESLTSSQLESFLDSSPALDRNTQILTRALPLETDWMAITVHIQPQGPRFQELRNAFRTAQQSRNRLTDKIPQTRNARNVVGELIKPIATELNQVLAGRIAHYLETARRSEGSPIRPNFDGIEQRPPRGDSAFVVTDGKTTEVFDFINISTRSAGFKVRFHGDKPYQGMRTVNIIFEYKDRFVLAETLAFDLYRRAGSPACLTEFVDLRVNGKEAGYHLLFEHINGSFLDRNDLPSNGDLYKILFWGGSPEGTHQRKGDWDGGHDELLALLAQLNDTSGAAQWEVINKHFDVQQVATYLAINTALSHWDGFFNNYFSYRDPKRDRWMMFPWDQDKTWGFYDALPEGQDFVDMPLTFGMEGDRPPSNFRGMRNSWWRPGGFFSRPLLANPTFREIYLKETKRILETIYTEEHYFPVIDALAEKLKPEITRRATLIGELSETAQARFQNNIESLKRHLTKRREFLLSQDDLK